MRPLAKFMWAGVMEILKCQWNLAGAGDSPAISYRLAGPVRQVV
jgi:hypothetical protein